MSQKNSSVTTRLFTYAGDLGRALEPHLQNAGKTAASVHKFAAKRSAVMEHNFASGAMGGFPDHSHLFNLGSDWMEGFPGHERAEHQQRKRRRRKY